MGCVPRHVAMPCTGCVTGQSCHAYERYSLLLPLFSSLAYPGRPPSATTAMHPMPQIVLEEEVDENYEPTEQEILEYAQWLGMDVDAEQ
eukprot:365752-Chlamydomonas_euryale.AAC.1